MKGVSAFQISIAEWLYRHKMTSAVRNACYWSHLRRWGLTPLVYLVYQS